MTDLYMPTDTDLGDAANILLAAGLSVREHLPSLAHCFMGGTIQERARAMVDAIPERERIRKAAMEAEAMQMEALNRAMAVAKEMEPDPEPWRRKRRDRRLDGFAPCPGDIVYDDERDSRRTVQ